MKYLICLCLVLAVSACSSRPRPTPPTPWMPQGPQLDKDVYDLTPGCTVFLGDSLTHIGWWRKWFPDSPTSNQGIGGNTTLQVLARLDPIVAAKPGKIFVLCGANDMFFGLDPLITASNWQGIMDRLQTDLPDTKIYWQTIMPLGAQCRTYFPDQIPPDYQQRIAAYNASLALLCAARGIPLLDTYSLMQDSTGHFRPEYTADQIHLEAPGYAVWVDFLRPYVED